MRSALYEGWVRHRRFAPVEHAFRYPLTMLYLDLAELPALFEREPLLSYGRPNLAWFRRADYLGEAHVPLDVAVRALVEARTGARPDGPIRMLTQLRRFGYLFNPVTFYFCHDAADTRVVAIVAEITNTPWHERHAYVLDRRVAEVRGRWQRFRFPKRFHVSPFLPMDLLHDWRFTEPGARLRVHMEDVRDGRVLLDATLALSRRSLGRRTLTADVLRHPLQTLRITTRIYAQALRLWWKRVPFFPHPRRPSPRTKGSSHAAALPDRPADAAPRARATARPPPRPRSPGRPVRRHAPHP